MKLIYMQETINYMHSLNPASLTKLEEIGTPKPVELLNDNGEIKTKYYVYDNTINSSQESKESN